MQQRRRFAYIVCAFAVLACIPEGSSEKLGVPFKRQTNGNYCAAASVQMWMFHRNAGSVGQQVIYNWMSGSYPACGPFAQTDRSCSDVGDGMYVRRLLRCAQAMQARLRKKAHSGGAGCRRSSAAQETRASPASCHLQADRRSRGSALTPRVLL